MLLKHPYRECPSKGRLQRIIVGHDLKNGGRAALESALALARRSDAATRLVHVIEPRADALHFARPKCRHVSIEERVTQSGADIERIVQSQHDCRRRMDYEVRVGNPFFELVLAACAWHADLVVIGAPSSHFTHLFGTTLERLVRKSSAPVLVTARKLNPLAKRFLVPTDFSPGARQAAEVGIDLAKNFGGQIFFLHVFDPTPWYTNPWDEESVSLAAVPELSADDVQNDWASFLRSLPESSVPWQSRTEEGRPSDAIVKYAEAVGADLIIMGTGRRSVLEHMLLGRIAETVVRRSSSPVLTIGPEGLPFSFR